MAEGMTRNPRRLVQTALTKPQPPQPHGRYSQALNRLPQAPDCDFPMLKISLMRYPIERQKIIHISGYLVRWAICKAKTSRCIKR